MTLREKVSALVAAWEAEIAEDRRVAALPDTWPDTRSTITCLALRTERCAADLRVLLAADEGGDAGPCFGSCCAKPTWVVDCACCEGTGEWEDGRPCVTCGGVGEVHVLRPRGPREGLPARTASPQPASESVVGDCGVATRREANPASASEVACPECAEMREALARCEREMQWAAAHLPVLPDEFAEAMHAARALSSGDRR